jgi:DNA adenine methylase
MGRALPLLRWAGSKRQIVPILARYWSDRFTRYVEPFAGSACLFFHLGPRAALLGDINGDLIATYRQVRRRCDEVSRTLCKMNPGKAEYYRIRSLQHKNLSPAECAARFIYLNRFCFNGLYRTNLQGNFNVPYGGQASGALPTLDVLRRTSTMLRHAVLVDGDFEIVLAKVRQGDFVYMDPPFSVSDRRMFREYDASGFGSNDVLRLRKRMDQLAETGIAFVVSYVESPEAEYLSKGFTVSSVSVRRNISGFLGSRVSCRELLISNSI